MKNNYQIFFLFLLISYITTCGPSDGSNPTKADDCKDDNISQTDKKLDYTHCCYVDLGIESLNSCIKLTSYQYENFGKIFKKAKKEGNSEFGLATYAYDLKVDCNSNHFQIYLLSLISLLILF